MTWPLPFAAKLSLLQSFLWFTSFVLTAFVIALAAGGTYITLAIGDYLFVVEQGWRLAQGQLPYRDFITPVGPLFYALIAGVDHLAHGNPSAYRLMGFAGILIFGPGLVWVAWRRLPGKIACFIAMAFAIIPLSPRELDGSALHSEFLALYNSLSWPLLATVMLGALFDVFEPARSDAHRRTVLDGLAIGLALLGLIGLKLTHGLIGSGIILTGLAIRPGNRPALKIALIFVISAIGVAYLIAPDLFSQHIGDLLTIGRSNDVVDRLTMKLAAFTSGGLATLLMTLLAIAFIERSRRYHPTGVGYGNIATAIVVALGAYAEAIDDHENTPAAISLLFLLLWLIGMRTNYPANSIIDRIGQRARCVLLAAPLFFWAAIPLAADSLALCLHAVHSWTQPATSWPTGLPGQAGQVNSLKLAVLSQDTTCNNAQNVDGVGAYLQALRQGVAELRSLHLDHARIYEVRFNNALAWLLQSPSPRGTLAWLDPGRTYSKASHPPVDSYLSDVDVLMISKLPEDVDRVRLFEEIFGATMAHDFNLIRPTACWDIYVRH